MTANFKTIFKCKDVEDNICYVTVECFGPNILEQSIANEKMLIDICIEEFNRLNVTPLNVEGLDYE